MSALLQRGRGLLGRGIGMARAAAPWLAGGAALTGLGIFGMSQLANSQGRAIDSVSRTGPLTTPGVGGGGGVAANDLKEQEKALMKMAARYVRITEALNANIQRNESLLDIEQERISGLEMLGSAILTTIPHLEKQLETSREIVATGRQRLAEAEALFKNESEAAKEAIKNAKSAEERMRAQQRLDKANTAILEQRRTLVSQINDAKARELEIIRQVGEGERELIGIHEQRIEAAERIAKATYMAPGAQQALAMKGIGLLGDKMSSLVAEGEKLKALMGQELAAAGGDAARQSEIRLKYEKQITTNLLQQDQTSAAIAEKADYVRRTWMEQFSEVMMGADSGTFLMPGASQLSGLQERGAAFMPFADANRGGGFGTYRDIYARFDPSLAESRTVAERSIAEGAAGRVVNVLNKFADALDEKMSRIIVGHGR
jgi:hypothetical protein